MLRLLGFVGVAPVLAQGQPSGGGQGLMVGHGLVVVGPLVGFGDLALQLDLSPAFAVFAHDG